jgi:hypothetical protein
MKLNASKPKIMAPIVKQDSLLKILNPFLKSKNHYRDHLENQDHNYPKHWYHLSRGKCIANSVVLDLQTQAIKIATNDQHAVQ